MGIIIRSAMLLILSLGLTVSAEAQWPLGKMPTVPAGGKSGPNVTVTGRFQIFVSPQEKDHTFMLDTDTGKIWILKKDHSTGDFSWKRVPVEGVDPEKAEEVDKKSEKKSEKKPEKKLSW
jgi:hypothetical protein